MNEYVIHSSLSGTAHMYKTYPEALIALGALGRQALGSDMEHSSVPAVLTKENFVSAFPRRECPITRAALVLVMIGGSYDT